MLQMAFRAVRTRWKLFLGTFVALTFAITVMASLFNILIAINSGRPLQGSPTRYDATSAVIAADQQIQSGQGEERQHTTLQDWRPLPATTALAIAKVPGIEQVVVDRSFKAIVVNKSGAVQSENKQTGHGWSSAQLTPFQLVAGNAPGPGQVVITQAMAQAAGIAIGDDLRIAVPAGTRQFEVAGIVRTAQGSQLPGEDTLFFADTEAAQLSGRPEKADAIAVIAAPGQNIPELRSRLLVSLSDKSLQVKTGDDKGGNIAADVYAASMVPVFDLIGFNVIISGFVCIFVVAATASFAIAQRRQEMALLRLLGATPRQVRRMVMSEALVVALASAIAGSLLGILCTGLLTLFLEHYEIVPSAFTAGGTWLGSLIASGIGVAVALMGVFLAARRAGKVRAGEAMREAVVEQRVMTPGRWVMGLLFLGISIALIVLMIVLGGVAGVSMAILVTEMLAVALALLMPVFIKPVVWLMTAPLVICTKSLGILCRANLQNAVRRTVSTAAPILVAISITVSIVGVNAMIAQADEVNMARRVLATHVISAGGNSIPPQSLETVRQIPGVLSAVSIPVSVMYPANDVTSSMKFGIVDPSTLDVFNIGVTAGSLSHLGKNDIVLTELTSQELQWKLNHTIPVFLADGTKVSLRVAAIVSTPPVIPEILVSPKLAEEHAGSLMSDNIFIRTEPGTIDTKELEAAAVSVGGQLQTKQAFLAERAGIGDRDSQVAMTMMLGLALAYLSIAIANTLLMAVSNRRKDIELLRKLGASDRQVVGMIAWETVIVAASGTLLALMAASLTILGVHSVFQNIIPGTPLPILQPAYFAVIGGSLLVALLASIIPTVAQLRRGPSRAE